MQADLPEEPAILGANGTTDNQQEDLPMENQPANHLPGLQTAQDVLPAHSGRIIRNMPCYDQSINQHNQGLVAWEVLLDQDDREDIPMAESQYAIQKSMDNQPL